MQWDDLRYFLEVERAGRMSRAARRLGVSHTTVARHIERLEADAGEPLFDRTDDGLVPTATGLRVQAHAEAMERAALAAAETLSGGAAGGGKVRIGAPDGIGNAVISGLLPQLALQAPELELALIPVPATQKLWRRDVDIAISLDRPQTGRLLMRKLTDYDLRLYASPDFFDRLPDGPEAVLDHPFVSYVDDLLYTEELNFARGFGRPIRVAYQAATVKAQLDAVRAGVGLGVLPCFMARDAGLVPVLPDDLRFQRTYWLLYPEEYRDLARIRRVADFLHSEVQARSALFRAP